MGQFPMPLLFVFIFAVLYINDVSGTSNSKWKFVKVYSDVYKFTSATSSSSNQCISLESTVAFQSSCGGFSYQHWKTIPKDGYIFLKNTAHSKCLEVKSSSDGALYQGTSSCSYNPKAQWTYANGQFKNRESGKCITVANTSENKPILTQSRC